MRNKKRMAQSTDTRSLLDISPAAALNPLQFKAMRNHPDHGPSSWLSSTQNFKDKPIAPSNPYPTSKERVKNMKKLNNYISKVKRLETERINLLRRENKEKEKHEKKLQLNQELKHAIVS